MNNRNNQRGNTKKKEWLLRYSELIEDMERETQAALYWREKSLSLSAVSLDNLGIHSSNSMSMPDYVIKFLEIAECCQKLATEAQEAKDNINQAISKIENIDQRRVLKLHYIDGYDFNEIANKLHYGLDWIWTLHRRGLDNLEIA